MIRRDELTEIGSFLKPHGIKGEISLLLQYDLDLSLLKCVVVCIDEIYVPFFIESIRPKGADTVLVQISGVDNEDEASMFSNLPVYALKSDLEQFIENDDDRVYVEDLIGYNAEDIDGNNLGVIEDINDDTENVLFIVNTPEGRTIFIPMAEEFIDTISETDKTVTFDLPDGILDL